MKPCGSAHLKVVVHVPCPCRAVHGMRPKLCGREGRCPKRLGLAELILVPSPPPPPPARRLHPILCLASSVSRLASHVSARPVSGVASDAVSRVVSCVVSLVLFRMSRMVSCVVSRVVSRVVV